VQWGKSVVRRSQLLNTETRSSKGGGDGGSRRALHCISYSGALLPRRAWTGEAPQSPLPPPAGRPAGHRRGPAASGCGSSWQLLPLLLAPRMRHMSAHTHTAHMLVHTTCWLAAASGGKALAASDRIESNSCPASGACGTPPRQWRRRRQPPLRNTPRRLTPRRWHSRPPAAPTSIPTRNGCTPQRTTCRRQTWDGDRVTVRRRRRHRSLFLCTRVSTRA
jgi:hypothetical protein